MPCQCCHLVDHLGGRALGGGSGWGGRADVTCQIFKIPQFGMSLYLGKQRRRLSLMTNSPEGLGGGGGGGLQVVFLLLKTSMSNVTTLFKSPVAYN